MSDRIRASVVVSGRVQGVGFRAATRRTAEAHGVDGWVRNREDGRVEAVFEGDPGDVDRLLEWCHGGSRAAAVEDVAVERGPPAGERGFEVRR